MPIIDISNLPTFTAVNLNSDPGHIKGKVVVPSAAQISLRWANAGGRICHNVLYGRYTGAFHGTQSEANAIMTSLTTGAAWTALAAKIHAASSFQGVDIRDVNITDQPLISSNVAVVPGTGAGSFTPGEVAACVTLRTAKVGRGNRGRMYLPGNWVASAVIAGDLVEGATVTAINNWVATIFTSLSSSGYTWALGQVHRAQYTSPGGVPHDDRPAAAPSIVTATMRDNHWDTIRRRGLK